MPDSPPDALAYTGADLSTPAVLAIVFLAVGLLVTLFFRVLGRGGRREH